MFSTSFVFCRLRAVTTPRQLPPGLVSAVSSSTCGAPCLRACSPQLVEPGKKLLEEEKKTTLPEGVCKKVSRRGVDDQTFCWRGIEGALLRRMGTKPEKCISLWNLLMCVFKLLQRCQTVVVALLELHNKTLVVPCSENMTIMCAHS